MDDYSNFDSLDDEEGIFEYDEIEYDEDRGMDAIQIDAQVLAMVGWGTDEDYGYFGEGEDW